MLITELLGPLSVLLKRGDEAYKNYISNGKTLLYAKIIKDNNEKIRQLILDKSYLLPVEQQSNAINLVTHIDIWHVLWNEHYKRKCYKINEEFSFENSSFFPKESVSSLIEYYLTVVNNKNYSKIVN